MAVKPVPDRYHTVTPYLTVQGVPKLIDFVKRVFDATELERMSRPDGTIGHAEVRIGDSVVEMGEAHGPYEPMPTRFYLYVPNVDASYRRALQAGATSVAEPADQPYGDRNAGVNDVFGNQWYIATQIKER